MVRSRCRRGRRIAKLRGMARQTVRAVMSIASLAAGIAALGFGVAGTSIAILDLTSGGVVEGRSVAGGSLPWSSVQRACFMRGRRGGSRAAKCGFAEAGVKKGRVPALMFVGLARREPETL